MLPLNEFAPDPPPAAGCGVEGAGGAASLRVLFVIPGEARGSSMIFARRQAQAVRAQGIAVHPFYLRSRTSPFRVVCEFRRFREELRRVRPQVVHAHYGTVTAVFAALGSRALSWGDSRGVPLVITYRGSDLNPSFGGFGRRLRGWLGRMLSQLAALAAARIVCVSAQLKQRLLWRRDRAIVLPSGVDPQVFYPSPRDQARRRLAWGDVPVVLFNAGNNPRIKRLDLAQAAAAIARRALPALRMEILHGACPPDLVPTLMNGADCLLVTSDSEGSPTVVQEALACNLPVVSVDVGDVAERLRGVRGARIVERDPGALAAALLDVLSRGERSDGRRKLDEFSSDKVAAKLHEVYGLLAGRRAPARERPSTGEPREGAC